MARPRRDAGTPEGRERLIAAFWSLLEMRELSDVTVGAIAAEADCNRGTFYYHFESLDALIQAAIETEILGEHTFSNSVLKLMIAGGDRPAEDIWREGRFSHIALLVKRGGLELVASKTKEVLLALWKGALCPEGGELNPRTRFILEYSMNGVLGMMVLAHSDGDQDLATFPTDFARHAAQFALDEISAAEGMPATEIAERIRHQAAR